MGVRERKWLTGMKLLAFFFEGFEFVSKLGHE